MTGSPFCIDIASTLRAYGDLKLTDPKDATRFFEKVGIGNDPYEVDRPLERFLAYEDLLKMLSDNDLDKYRRMHKGNPYYFLGWTAFQMKNYEKAVFYMDSAVSEDRENCLPDWKETPAGCFILLNEEGNQAAIEFTKDLKAKIVAQYTRFNELSHQDSIGWGSFSENFIKSLAERGRERSILTALYSFILEYQDRCQMLELRGCGGGSIEPFLVHLFKGAVIFESILKDRYRSEKRGRTLGDIYCRETRFRDDYCIAEGEKLDTFGDDFIDIVNSCRGQQNAKNAFEATAKIRNSSGHDLARSDGFLEDPLNYSILFEQEINALLFLIAKKYVGQVDNMSKGCRDS